MVDSSEEQKYNSGKFIGVCRSGLIIAVIIGAGISSGRHI
jgi:hypothetical protein